MRPRQPIITDLIAFRFWTKVASRRGSDCWEWTATSTGGYGMFGIAGYSWLAHRLSWFLIKGWMPTRALLHSCDNRKCVNPEHLREGTDQDNAADRQLRNRSARGESHGQAKLQERDVLAIRAAHLNKTKSQKTLARQYGVSAATINKIVTGQRWKHLDKEYINKLSKNPDQVQSNTL